MNRLRGRSHSYYIDKLLEITLTDLNSKGHWHQSNVNWDKTFDKLGPLYSHSVSLLFAGLPCRIS